MRKKAVHRKAPRVVIPSLYAELVIYAEKGKQAPHTREGITTGGALLKPKVLKA